MFKIKKCPICDNKVPVYYRMCRVCLELYGKEIIQTEWFKYLERNTAQQQRIDDKECYVLADNVIINAELPFKLGRPKKISVDTRNRIRVLKEQTPKLSLRQIAIMVGVSYETVRRVSNK